MKIYVIVTIFKNKIIFIDFVTKILNSFLSIQNYKRRNNLDDLF